MFWFRSFALGLMGACCLLLATRPQTSIVLANPPPFVLVADPAACPAPPDTASGVTVIDVAPGVPGALIAQLVVLAANEHITAIDDVGVADGRAALAALDLRGRTYIDVAIASDAGASRRVLVLAAR